MPDFYKSRNLANSCGYPFQNLVGEQTKKGYENHSWRVLVTEQPWWHMRTQEMGFIDLVLEKESDWEVESYMVIECKRLSGGQFIFLTTANSSETSDTHLLSSHALV